MVSDRPYVIAGIVVVALSLSAAGSLGAAASVGGTEASVGSQTTTIDDCTTITQPGTYELTADIEDDPDDECIHVKTDDVVFDGNGHLIEGVDDDDTYGVLVEDGVGFGTIEIRNVELRDWEEGVRVEGGEPTVENVEAYENFDGIKIDDVLDVSVVDVTARDNDDDGIHLVGLLEGTVEDSRVYGNGDDGVYVDGLAETGDIVDNEIRDNGDDGVHGFATDITTYSRNVIEDNGGDGIYVTDVPGPDAFGIHSNHLQGNGDDGIDLRRSQSVTVENNTACRNDDSQYLFEDTIGLSMTDNDIGC